MKVERFKIRNWKEEQIGLIIDEADDWVLVKHIPVDYVIDGYRLYRKKFIEKRYRHTKDSRTEKVLSLRNTKANKPDWLRFTGVIETLRLVQDKYGLFEFRDGEEEELFYGRVNRTDGNKLRIDFIDPAGAEEKDYDYWFDMEQIRVIQFEGDYFDAIRLLWKDENS